MLMSSANLNVISPDKIKTLDQASDYATSVQSNRTGGLWLLNNLRPGRQLERADQYQQCNAKLLEAGLGVLEPRVHELLHENFDEVESIRNTVDPTDAWKSRTQINLYKREAKLLTTNLQKSSREARSHHVRGLRQAQGRSSSDGSIASSDLSATSPIYANGDFKKRTYFTSEDTLVEEAAGTESRGDVADSMSECTLFDDDTSSEIHMIDLPHKVDIFRDPDETIVAALREMGRIKWW